VERFQELSKAQAQEAEVERSHVRLKNEDNRKSEKRSNKNSYEAKANVIEDSKGEASTSKGLKRKKTTLGYKVRTKKVKISASKELATSATKRDIRRMNITVVPKRTRSNSHKQT